jgi:hypothetical protein
MDLTVAELDNYGYTNFTGDGTTFLKMYTSSHPYFLDLYEVGDVITMTFNVYTVNYADITLEGVVLPDLTDQDKLDISVAQLEVDLELKADVVLPTTNDFGATISWATSDAAVITDAGVITRPAIGQPDGTATLTATITVGSLTAVTKDFAITVKALQPDLNGGTETLTNLTDNGTSYGDGTFTGDQGVEWTFVDLRHVDDGYRIGATDASGMFKESGDYLEASITGGIGDFSIDLRTGFTSTPATLRSVEIFVNGVSVGTYTLAAMDTVETFTITGINITGEFTLKIMATGTKQMVIDNITWTGYTGS